MIVEESSSRPRTTLHPRMRCRPSCQVWLVTTKSYNLLVLPDPARLSVSKVTVPLAVNPSLDSLSSWLWSWEGLWRHSDNQTPARVVITLRTMSWKKGTDLRSWSWSYQNPWGACPWVEIVKGRPVPTFSLRKESIKVCMKEGLPGGRVGKQYKSLVLPARYVACAFASGWLVVMF